MTTYSTRDEAIQREIIDPIEATGVITDARAAYNIDAIADKLLSDYRDGYAPTLTPEDFWTLVAQHER